jgi:hypothetical protein
MSPQRAWHNILLQAYQERPGWRHAARRFVEQNPSFRENLGSLIRFMEYYPSMSTAYKQTLVRHTNDAIVRIKRQEKEN